MVTCPVCEHQQQAANECENCGKKFVDAAGGVVVANVEPVEGLESTGNVAALNVAVEPMTDLEVVGREGLPNVPVEPMPDVEHSRFEEAAGQVPVEQIPDLEQGRAPDDGVRTQLPVGSVTCRYCRNVQAEGVLCEKCGMRLPAVASPVEAVVAGTVDPNAQKVWTRCRKCGAPAAGGHRCGDCGHEVPMPEA